MPWTDERLRTLERMWEAGFTASEIAEELGNVSRNAVIGKAYRIGLQGRSVVTPEMLGKVEQIPFSRRVAALIASQNIIYVGDLAQMTEAELLRIPGLGRLALNEVKEGLKLLGLRLGTYMPAWPPSNIEEELAGLEIAQRASKLRQIPGGATFQPRDDHFEMVPFHDESDEAAAARPAIKQMQEALVVKARSFSELASRLDNQVGWSGIKSAVESLSDLLNRETAEIPPILGYIYPIAIELGSFIELDNSLRGGIASYAMPLDPEMRRPLSDLVRNLAPWLRSFPSARQLDDEASEFLVQVSDLKSTLNIVKAADAVSLLKDADVEMFTHLSRATQQGEFQAKKAGGRVKRSASNFVIGVVAFAGGIYGDAVANRIADRSHLISRISDFLVRAEDDIGQLAQELPQDLRYSVEEFVSRFPLRGGRKNPSNLVKGSEGAN